MIHTALNEIKKGQDLKLIDFLLRTLKKLQKFAEAREDFFEHNLIFHKFVV